MKQVSHDEPPSRDHACLVGELRSIDQRAKTQTRLSDAEGKLYRRAGFPASPPEANPEHGKQWCQRENEEGIGGAELCGGEGYAKQRLVRDAVCVERHGAGALLEQRPENHR